LLVSQEIQPYGKGGTDMEKLRFGRSEMIIQGKPEIIL